MGAGKSLGMQRDATPNKAPTSRTGTKACSQPGHRCGRSTRCSSAQALMGWPAGRLAAGLGLAALASHFGFGGELASMLMMGLLAAGIMVAVGFFLRKRAAAKAWCRRWHAVRRSGCAHQPLTRSACLQGGNARHVHRLQHRFRHWRQRTRAPSDHRRLRCGRFRAPTPRSTSSVCKRPTTPVTWTTSASSHRPEMFAHV